MLISLGIWEITNNFKGKLWDWRALRLKYDYYHFVFAFNLCLDVNFTFRINITIVIWIGKYSFLFCNLFYCLFYYIYGLFSFIKIGLYNFNWVYLYFLLIEGITRYRIDTFYFFKYFYYLFKAFFRLTVDL